MTDIRLKTRRLTVGGKEYELACTMNVLADLQEAHGGNISEALLDSTHSINAALELVSIMVNNYAEIQGWPERYTPRQIGHLISGNVFREICDIVAELLSSSLATPDEDKSKTADEGKQKTEPAEETDETEESKNA